MKEGTKLLLFLSVGIVIGYIGYSRYMEYEIKKIKEESKNK